MAHPEEPTLPEDTGQRNNKNMEVLMKIIVRRTALALMLLALVWLLPNSASAVCKGFVDVPDTAEYCESVWYLAEREIAAGTGNDCFSPEQLITVEQWAVMLCRAYGVEGASDSWQDVSRSSVVEAYRQGWLNATAVTAPQSPMCCSVLLESALAAADVPVYDSTLYEGAASLSSADNILRVGRELGLCADDVDANALVTRGEAAIILYTALAQSFNVEAPPAPVTLENRSGINANAILLELQYVPRPILDAFNARGWQLVIDCNYIAELGRRCGVGCTGATDYAERMIYVSEAGAVLHEFGHFLDWLLVFPTEHERLFRTEAAAAPLRNYAKTDSREYFADCFSYYITYGSNSEMMEHLRKNMPQTCAYFEELAKGGWSRNIHAK